MSRIELAGHGGPIPTISLPDPNSSGERPTLELILEDGVPFEKEAYTSLGYTHYEVWCVGGSGGRGGDVGQNFVWESFKTPATIPIEVWNAQNELGDSGVSYWRPEAGGWYTATQWREYTNPTHQGEYTTFHDAVMYDPAAWGGGGGGGGLHVVFGELDALPDICLVEVGAAGADAPIGQMVVNAPYVPTPTETWVYTSNYPTGWSRDLELLNIINAWTYRYPEPRTIILPPQPGEDGGLSSFGDVCQASGGKGGGAGLVWESGLRVFKGFGGDGGAGNQTDSGGGAPGSNSGAGGTQGEWDGVSIGKGGGGGRGGTVSGDVYPMNGDYATWEDADPTYPRIPLPGRVATDGGNGSFSYIDTSVYGKRQFASTYSGDPTGSPAVPSGDWYDKNAKVVPGGGGGARANRKYPTGSDAQGYSQGGIVLLRLIKLDD